MQEKAQVSYLWAVKSTAQQYTTFYNPAFTFPSFRYLHTGTKYLLEKKKKKSIFFRE